MSLHNIELASEFFPRIVGLRAGRVLFDSSPASLEPSAMRELFDLGHGEALKA